MNYAVSLLFLFSLLLPALSLYFHIQEKEEKCFIEEIPTETPVIGAYKIETFDIKQQVWVAADESIGMHVTIKGPDRNLIQSKDFTSEGRFSFTSNYPGEHSICLRSTTDQWFGGTKLRVHLDIQVRIAIDRFLSLLNRIIPCRFVLSAPVLSEHLKIVL